MRLARAALELSRALESQPILLMNAAIVCNEPWAIAEPALVTANARGTYVEDLVASELTNNFALCSTMPTLALAGEADPVLPPSAIAGIGTTMPNSRLSSSRDRATSSDTSGAYRR
jgi:hypothetical protein